LTSVGQSAQTDKGRTYLGVVHRLDQPVEGIMVFAKTKAAAKALSMQLATDNNNESAQAGQCKKTYLAVIYTGQRECPKSGTLTDYLMKDAKANLARIVGKDNPQGKKAVLSYEILEQKEDCACVKVVLQTGRFHQIRAQMANAGLPLLGDLKYATQEAKAKSQKLQIRNVALCAHELSFVHPTTGQKMKNRIKPTNKAFQDYEIE
jgi:23S rRNA pseudouridine1911/1915/1917 synthase